MNQLRIGVMSQIPNLLNELRAALPSMSFHEIKNDDPELNNSEVLVADFDLLGPVLYKLPNIKWVQGTWAGVDALLPHINMQNPPSYPIVRYSGIHFGRIISEYVIACIVNHERDFFKMYENQTRSRWDVTGKIATYRTIADLNVGILGIGSIGSRLGNILNILGANVFALGRRATVDGDSNFSYLTEYYTDLENLLPHCDYIVNTLPLTKETRGLLSGDILNKCKGRKSIFINVGRGGIINDSDLLRAIEKGWISAAFLDVFNEEPLPENSPLWKSPQIKISPHTAAMSRPKDIAEQFSQNLSLYVHKKPFPTLVDFDKSY